MCFANKFVFNSRFILAQAINYNEIVVQLNSLS